MTKEGYANLTLIRMKTEAEIARAWGFLLIAFLFLQCTNKEITKREVYTENVIAWSETRKLTWDDFQGAPILEGVSVVSEIVVKNFQ